MNNQIIVEQIEVVKKIFPKNAVEISDALDMLSYSLDELLNNANTELTQSHKNKEYDKSKELLKISEFVAEIQNKINQYSAAMSIEEENDDEEPDKTNGQLSIPDYSKFVVDSTIPHSFSESFTNKKITSLIINNKRFVVKDWKDALLKTCEYLITMNKSKFLKLIDDPVTKGRKISYFGNLSVESKNAKLNNMDIYVWTNLSANSIKNLIKKMLLKYGIKPVDCQIFLRADYSPLHQETKGM